MPALTQIMVVEHRVFSTVFDQIEQRLPALQTLDEVRSLADLIESRLKRHGELEENLSYTALDHMLAERGQLQYLYQDHKEIDGRLAKIKTAQGLDQARRLLAATMIAARKHFRREEEFVFPLLEKVLQRNTLRELADAWIHLKQIPGQFS